MEDLIAANSLAYKRVALELDPMYVDMVKYNEAVKKFIIDGGYIIYGGTAIDYALRLRGDSIYADDDPAFPDFDFYAADSVGAAYDFADILYRMGAEGARAIVAIHVEAMRVDAGQYHWIADISFHPDMFNIPTIVYAGMKCVHPDYQRADLHSALSFPFDNAPQEVIFHRWKKDVCRLGKFDELYPIVAPQYDMPKTQTHELRDLPLHGWAAYSLLIDRAVRDGVKFDGKKHLIVSFKHGKVATFHTNNGAEYLCDKIDYNVRPYVNLMPKREKQGDVTLYDTSNRLASVVTVDDIVCSCLHAVSQYMIGRWFSEKDPAALAAYATLTFARTSRPDLPYLGLSVQVYGSSNVSHAQEIEMMRARGESLDGVPKNYNAAKTRPPPFDYASEYFKIDGSAKP